MLFIALSGLLLSINVYFYNAAKMAPFILGCFWVFLWLKKKFKLNAADIAIPALVTFSSIIFFIPLLEYIMKYPDAYFARMTGLNLLNSMPKGSEFVVMVGQFFIFFDMFFVRSCSWPAFNLPFISAFDNVMVFFMIAGLGYMLYRWKDNSNFFVALWMFFGVLVAYLTVTLDLYQSRMVLALPPIAIIAAIGMEKIIKSAENVFPPKLKFLSLTILLAGVTFIIFDNLNNYYGVFPNDPAVNFAYRNTAKRVADFAGKYPGAKVVFSEQYAWRFGDDIRAHLLNHKLKQEYSFLPASSDYSQIFDNNGKDVLLIMEGIYEPQAQAFKEFFPGAVIEKHWNKYFWIYDTGNPVKYSYWGKNADESIKIIHNKQNDEPINISEPKIAFISVLIPAADISRSFGLKSVYYLKEVKLKESVTTGEIINDAGADRIELSGMMFISAFEKINIRVEDAVVENLLVDSAPVSTFNYSEGFHAVKMSIRVNAGKIAKIMVRDSQTGSWVPVQPSRLMSGMSPHKVRIDYYDKNNSIFYVQNMPALNAYFFFYKPAVVVTKTSEPQFKAVWNAKISIEEDGLYQAKIDTGYRVQLYVDEKMVFDNGPWPFYMKVMDLKKGVHTFRAQSDFSNNLTNFRLVMKKENEKYFYAPYFADYK